MHSFPSLGPPPVLSLRRVTVKGVHEGVLGSYRTEVSRDIGGVPIRSLVKHRLCTGNNFAIKKHITYEQIVGLCGGTKLV